jgi:hypothetical protein
MYKLVVEHEALEDIKSMIAAGGRKEVYARRILVILQELKASQGLLSELTTDKFETDNFDVKSFKEFWNDGVDLWRLKIYDFLEKRDTWITIPYRVLYAYDVSALTFRILGIAHRKIAYDSEHEQTKRICRTYYALGLPRHKLTHFRASGRHKPH